MSIDLMKRQIETQMAEYESALADFAVFMDAWRSRNDPAAKRIRRFREAAAKRESAT